MNRYPSWKYLIIAVSILLGLVYTLPNFYGESPAVQISPLRTAPKADTALLQRVEDALKKANLPVDGMFLEAGGVKVRFADTDTQIKARDVLQAKRAKEQKLMIEALQKGDELATASGILGRVVKVVGNYVILQIAENVQVTIQKTAVQTLLPKGTLNSIEKE